MDEEYMHNVKEAMDYLAANGRSKWTVRGHEECYSRLVDHLRDN